MGSSRWGQKLAHSRWIKPAHMERAREYFARFGAMTITVARFVPIVRTLAPFVAGLSQMPRVLLCLQRGRRRRLVQLDDAGRLLAGLHPLGPGQPALGLGHHHRPVADPRRAAMAAGAAHGAAALTPGAGLARY
ncbi:VTT domain-containing protein [Achromobacter xylosoxidans]